MLLPKQKSVSEPIMTSTADETNQLVPLFLLGSISPYNSSKGSV